MKTISQSLPKEQKAIIRYSLEQREKQLEVDIKRYENIAIADKEQASDLENMRYELFDIFTLKALLEYEVSVSMTDSQHEHFTAVNHVDYPNYL